MLDFFKTPERALQCFREGASMAKGTTTAVGLGHNYFANIFGPPQYRDLHEELATEFFNKAFDTGVKIGQMRTRLGIPGYEASGPQEVAKTIFEALLKA